jgi:hypothetical protein
MMRVKPVVFACFLFSLSWFSLVLRGSKSPKTLVIGSLEAFQKNVSTTWTCKPLRISSRVAHHSTLKTLRFSESSLNTYLREGVVQGGIEGWVEVSSIYMIAFLSKVQIDKGLFGAVGEIGVHHGKFTAALSGFSIKGVEDVVAVDLFSNQVENADLSGKGDLVLFQQHLEDLSLADSLHIKQANSLALSSDDFSDFKPFRLLSVDGGHTHDVTFSDMFLACNLVAEGGIFVVDDFVNVGWLGVVDGVFDFLRNQDSFVPFLWIANKLYLTSTESHAEYRNAIRSIDELLCDNAASRAVKDRAVFPLPVCIVHCSETDVSSMCTKLNQIETVLQLFTEFEN